MTILRELLVEECPQMHGRRREALLAAVEATIRAERLTLTAVGREVSGNACEKHKVKRIDRLVGNPALQGECPLIYRAMAHRLLAAKAWVPILVDWTDGPQADRVMLEAAVALGGRAVTIYQQVHRLASYKRPGLQARFIGRLAQLVPPGCRPIVMADAGFQRSFFAAVEAQGWHWVGRLPEPLQVRAADTVAWQPLQSLYAGAAAQPRDLGHHELRRKAPYIARLCLVQPARCHRRDRPNDRDHGHGTVAGRYQKLYRGPWLLATNLTAEAWTAADIVDLYAQRMQIEETFRDLKSHRLGYAMTYSRSRRCARLAVLRLLGALAMFVNCLVGLTAHANDLARYFQANTERDRPVLSWLFLARRLWRSTRFALALDELRETLAMLPKLTAYHPLTS